MSSNPALFRTTLQMIEKLDDRLTIAERSIGHIPETWNNNRMLVSSGDSVTEMPAMTNGDLIIGLTGGAPQIASLSGSGGVTITEGAGSLTIGMEQSMSVTGTPSFASLSVTNTSGQITLGTTTTTQITAPTPASSVVVTIPDGGANSEFVLTQGTQTVVGTKTFSGSTNLGTVGTGITTIGNTTGGSTTIQGSVTMALASTSTIDTTSVDESDTLNIGTVNADIINIGNASAGQVINVGQGAGAKTINIGKSGDTVNVVGTTTFVNSTNLNVKDKNITVNKGGVAESGGSAGLDVEEGGSITGYINVNSSDRASWDFVAPATVGVATIKPGASGFELNNTGTAKYTITSAQTTELTATIPALSTNADFVMTEGAQTIDGTKTIDGTINMSTLSASKPLMLDGSKNITAGNVGLTTQVTGVLPIANGGTNSSTALNNNRVMLSASDGISESAALSDAQLIGGNTGSAPTVKTLTGTSNQITVTNASNSLTLSLPQNIHTSATPSFASETLSNTSNQLTFGNGTTTTINAIAPGVNATYNIPDVGATGSFVMTAGNQTIAGNKTLSGTTTYSGLTASKPLKLNGSYEVISADVDLASQVTGTLAVAHGGTGVTTAFSNDRVLISSGGVVSETASLSDGQVVSGNTGTAPSIKTLTGTSGQITITNAAGSITFATPQSIATTSTPTFASETLSATSNQLTLGTTTTTTLSATAPASSSIYVIPDVGTTGSFVMTEGSQTINGGKTLSTQLTINPVSNQLVLGGLSASNTVTLSAPTPGVSSRTHTIPDITGNGTFAFLEGTQTFSGAKTMSSALSINPLTDQLVLGGTGGARTVTLTAPQPAVASRTHTIPDVGANSEFVMLAGSQTLTGNKTFSGTVNLSELTATSPLLLDGSKNVTTGSINLGSQVTSVLPIANGGTNSSVALVGGRIMISSGGGIVESAGLADGEIFIGHTGSEPHIATITGTSNQINVTNGTGSITLSTPQNIDVTATPTFASETLTAVSDQLTLGTTRTVTITAPTPATNSRTHTIPDVSGDANFIMSLGTQNIGGSKTMTSALTINPTSNQLVLGGVASSNTVTLSATTPSASSINTIPDVGATGTFAMLQGTQTFSGAKTFSSALTVDPLTDQLVLGGTGGARTVTLTAPQPAVASRTHTIPDVGANSEFVMLAGAQTLTGNKTFTGSVHMSELIHTIPMSEPDNSLFTTVGDTMFWYNTTGDGSLNVKTLIGLPNTFKQAVVVTFAP